MLPNIHQLDAAMVTGQARGGHGHPLLTLEFDLDADRALHAGFLLLGYTLLLGHANLRQLCAKRAGMLLPVLWLHRHFVATAALGRISLDTARVLREQMGTVLLRASSHLADAH
uniref:hypothetical protein n=1 Tax=Hydrogenophaga sp. TaxID=1904254 RepID=UPI0040353850